MMPLNWTRYCEQLREVDINLYNLKEQFKMGLLTSTNKLKDDVQETVNNLDASSSSEL